MKRIIYLIIAAVSVSFAAAAQQMAGGRITIGDVQVAESDGVVGVSFTAEVGRKAAGRNQMYVFSPVLTDGNYRVSLPAVVIEGKGNKISRMRREWAYGVGETYGAGAIHASNGSVVNYHTTVEAQRWMHGGQLRMEGVLNGCCASLNDREAMLAGKLYLYDDPQPVEIVTEVRKFAPKSIGDSLSMIFPFVLPESMFDPDDPFKIYDDERDNSMIVFFHQGKQDVVYEYRNNYRTLTNLRAAVEMLISDSSSKVERMMVAGFASPEGTYEVNDRLAYNRAAAVRRYILNTTGMKDDQVQVYNGSVDWRGLYLLAERSNMPYKGEVLDILNNVPVWGGDGRPGRLDRLKSLHNGEPYRYMYEEFFPMLRNGALIKVYYSNPKN